MYLLEIPLENSKREGSYHRLQVKTGYGWAEVAIAPRVFRARQRKGREIANDEPKSRTHYRTLGFCREFPCPVATLLRLQDNAFGHRRLGGKLSRP